MELNPSIITLYKYYVYAVQMRIQFRKEMNPDWRIMLNDDYSSFMLFFFSPPGIYFCYSYSGIYLVIEGRKELKLEDEKIDKLVLSPYVDRLRLFRNATFHYQKEPISNKLLQFFGTEEEGTEKWLNEIYTEFGRYFKENTLPVPADLKEELKDKEHSEIAKIVQKYWED